MEDLFKTLPAIMNAFPDSDEIRSAVIGAAWRRAVGEGLSPHSIVLGFESGRLIVTVRDKIWKRNLESMAPELIYKVNALVGNGSVRFIEFEHEDVPESLFSKIPEPITESKVNPLPEDLVAAAGKIKDPKLRNRFLSTAATYLDARDKRLENG